MNFYKTILLCSAMSIMTMHVNAMFSSNDPKQHAAKDKQVEASVTLEKSDAEKKMDSIVLELKKKIEDNKFLFNASDFNERAPALDDVALEFNNQDNKDKDSSAKERLKKWKNRFYNYQTIFNKDQRKNLAEVMDKLAKIDKFEKEQRQLYTVGFYVNQIVRLYKEMSAQKVLLQPGLVNRPLIAVMPAVAAPQDKDAKGPIKVKFNNIEYDVEKLPIEDVKNLTVDDDIRDKVLQAQMTEADLKFMNDKGGMIIQGIYDPKIDSKGEKVDRYKLIAANIEVKDKEVSIASANYIKMTPSFAPFQTMSEEELMEQAKEIDRKLNPVERQKNHGGANTSVSGGDYLPKQNENLMARANEINEKLNQNIVSDSRSSDMFNGRKDPVEGNPQQRIQDSNSQGLGND